MEKVICKDLFGQDHEVNADDLVFRLSAYGLIIKNNKILMTRQWDGFALPGGGVEKGETPEEALQREVFEETGLKVKVRKFLCLRESLFYFKSPNRKEETYHGVLLFFLCETIGNDEPTLKFQNSEELIDVEAEKPEWVSLDKIDSVKLYSTANLIEIISKYATQTEK